MAKQARVIICVPSLGEWKARLGMSIAGLGIYTVTHSNTEVAVSSCVGSILPNLRSDMVKTAQREGMTHLLMVDADMSFGHDFLINWLRHDKPVIAANCMIKQVPSQSTARNWSENRWVPVYTMPDSVGLERVDRIGTGIMLINMKVFEQIEQPYFEMRWLPDMNGYQGEDWCFCEKLEQAGIPLYIDHSMSRSVLHVGDFCYSHKYVKPHLIIVDEPVASESGG